MASILDQHEQSLYTGQQNALGEREKPMFAKSKMNFDPQGQITHFVVSDVYIVVVMDSRTMLKMDMRNPKNVQTIELNRLLPGVLPLIGVFLDPTGNHLFLSYPTELLYHNRKLAKPKCVSKLKGNVITAIGWYSGPRAKGDSSSKPILLGTKRGAIIEIEISSDDSLYQVSLLSYSKQLFDIGRGSSQAITGLQYHKIDSSSNEYFVIVTTVNRLYHFIGKNSGPDERPLLHLLFYKYYNNQESYMVIPSSLEYSVLQYYTPVPSTSPTHIAWLTEPGLFYASIDAANEAGLLTNTKMFNFPSVPPPISFVMTQFHLFLLYPTNVTVVSILNSEVVFVDNFNESYGRLVGIVKDPVSGIICVYAERAVFRYNIFKEDRNVWQIYMDQEDYEKAKQFCKDNPANLDQVLLKQADKLFDQEKYEESAIHYAETQYSFEDIALKFLKTNQNKALKTFLIKKLSKLNPREKAQSTMLILWVVELMLTELASMRLADMGSTSKYSTAQDELHLFLTRPDVKEGSKKNKRAIYDLMERHGDRDNLTKFAEANKDYERLIYDAIYKGDNLQALSILKKQKSPILWYQFTPTLVQTIPRETVGTIMAEQKPLDPAKILPALIAAADTYQPGELIRYLEYCINDLNCQEEAVHNFLLSLYAQHKPDKLMTYLAMQGEDAGMVNYDVGYALRTCQMEGRKQACVFLSSLLGLWDNAVEQALGVSVELAKEKAAQANDRKLWLKIAEHIVKNKNDIAQAMKFIQQCDSIKIEDILPFFPDFVTIDHFKDAICSSLEEYNQHIQDLNDEMDDATKSAEAIREEIQSFRSQYTIIGSMDKCESCGLEVLGGGSNGPMKAFYAFPCGHKFHSSCIARDIVQFLSDAEASTLASIQNQLVGDPKSSSKDKLKAELDTILASQCLLCGDRMIENIKKPLIPDEEYDILQEEWK